jgi:hypothetical protein
VIWTFFPEFSSVGALVGKQARGRLPSSVLGRLRNLRYFRDASKKGARGHLGSGLGSSGIWAGGWAGIKVRWPGAVIGIRNGLKRSEMLMRAIEFSLLC